MLNQEASENQGIDMTSQTPHPGMGFKEFVGLVAALMAINAIAIDSMLPALGQIGDALGVANANERQWIITAYMLGFGGTQIVYGTLTDRFGRKPVLLWGLSGYTIFTLAIAASHSFDALLAGRVLQGVAAASTRVVSVSVVRDCYAGRLMARVMSLALIVFIGVPVFAPSAGQLILLVAPWQGIFLALGAFGFAVLLWVWLRLPETLHEEDRKPIAFDTITQTFGFILSNRVSMGYTIASTMIFGAMLGFINSAQQLFTDVFHAGRIFPVIFALIATFIAISSLLNARLVDKLGMRKLSHSALLAFITIAGIHATLAISGHDTLWTFAILQSCMMLCLGLMMGNFGAIAMEPLGHVAGSAASVQGFVSTVGAALLGFFVGQSFNGTDIPLELGFVTLGLSALAVVLFAENGRLFQPHNQLAEAAYDHF
jgi:DHA1 family bicyclomycin/chloramphenicol resistance-like MFS transporter